MSQKTARAIKIYSFLGYFLIALLVVGVGGWAAWASISGAVIAQGTVTVEGASKKIQHAEGGIVSEIHIKDGQYVKAGQILIRLDETEIKANLQIVIARLNELFARQARLEAERDSDSKINFPEFLLKDRSADMVQQIAGQKKLFSARRSANQGKKEQLEYRIVQLKHEIIGLEEQYKAKQKQTQLIEKELKALRILKEKDLVPAHRLLTLEREAARIAGALGEHVAAIARARGKESETRLSIIQIDQDFQTEVLSELRDVQTKIAEYVERKVAAETKMKRTEIRAPKDGYVHQLNVHTIGGVISASEPAMLIVPQQDQLEVEALIEPHSIDQIQVGQKAMLRFSAFDQRTTPELLGEVSKVSADLTRQSAESPAFYTARIRLTKAELDRIGDKRLKPGMPAEVFIQTGARTALSYLIKPLTDQLMRAFRER